MSSLAKLIRQWSTARFTAPGQAAPARYDARLDGLRGFAAWSVMVVHSFGYAGPSPLSATNEYVRHLHMSRAGVLLFFITSGYVIGLTNCREYSGRLARDYLARRCLRIWPIYLIAIAAGWLADRNVTGLNVLANSFFLQNAAWNIPPLEGDLPVWSLHNEVVYYLAFAALWALRPKVLPVLATMLAFTGWDWFVGGPLSFLGGWSAGGLFWLAGLLLAWKRPAADGGPILGYVLLTYATDHLWPGTVLLVGLGFPNAGHSPVWLSDLSFLPGTVVIFSGLLGFRFPGLNLLRWATALLPVGTCLILLKMGRLWENVPWTMASIATVIALPLLAVEANGWGQALFRLFRPLGRISYGLYLFHVPCATFVCLLYPWTDNRLNYLGGLMTWLATTILLAWLCEARLQPMLLGAYKQRFAPLPLAAATPAVPAAPESGNP